MSIAETRTAALSPRLAPAVFVITLFLSAGLLFFVQPLFTRIALPHVGGSPAVWTTAMLFFQTVLIAGYLYAHLLTRTLPVRWQVLVHLGVWAAALASLPLTVPEGWRLDAGGSVAGQTLMLLAAGVGLPFFALSANAPLIQFWYSRSGGPSADDPYFLYGASNLGSLLALLGFPLLAEPLFGAGQIGLGWAAGFALLGFGLATSGLMAGGPAAAAPLAQQTSAPAPGLAQVAHWAFLAFIPSSLMLGVTLKISIDMGAVPLVWALPLSLYLASFVLAFSNRHLVGDRALAVLAALALAVIAFHAFGLHGNYLKWSSAALLLIAFFVVALFAHRRLYAARPDGRRLTGFYLTMSVGGALGGVFNSILAPLAFSGLWELPITTALAVLLFLRLRGSARACLGQFGQGALLGLAVASPALLLGLVYGAEGWGGTLLILLIGAPLCLAVLRQRALAFVAACAALLLAGTLLKPDDALLRERSFFGTHVVTEDGGRRIYGNGTTVHGAQRITDDAAARPEPLYYYHRNGPLAQVLTSARADETARIGIVGLGVGSLACYAKPGQDWHFYEIDRTVDEIARTPRLFRFLSACTPEAPTHLGDARMVLAAQDDMRFDILVVDAYSSDAVPVHLTTNEAMRLYLDRLAPDGLLVYHISNRYYDIDVPLARSAADLGLAARIQRYRGHVATDPADSPSTAVLLARSPAALGALGQDPRWQALQDDGGPVWTDDYANLISIIRR